MDIGNLNKKSNRYKNNLYIKDDNTRNYYLDQETIDIASVKNRSASAAYNSGNLISFGMNFDSITSIKKSIITCTLEALFKNNIKSGDGQKDSILCTDYFYHYIKNFSAFSSPLMFNDKELLLLYIKQFIIIFKNTNILNNKTELTSIQNFSFIYTQLYFKMFDSFWNKVNWPGLFPSMPEAARSLKINRKVLISLMLKEENKFKIDRISNLFFKNTGLARANDLFFISFLDFYFFTWLSHFGIIKYLNGNNTEAVEIELTKLGRIIFEFLI